MQDTKALAAGRDHRGRWGGEHDGHFQHHFPAAEGNTLHPTGGPGEAGLPRVPALRAAPELGITNTCSQTQLGKGFESAKPKAGKHLQCIQLMTSLDSRRTPTSQK